MTKEQLMAVKNEVDNIVANEQLMAFKREVDNIVALRDNLKATQERCTELCEALRQKDRHIKVLEAEIANLYTTVTRTTNLQMHKL